MVHILMEYNIYKGNTGWETTAKNCKPQISVTVEATKWKATDVAPTTAISSGGLLCLN
tara:strand:- start:377 stop:550 length:174 start_codon:yes stop_codon:yes gene_type:complete